MGKHLQKFLLSTWTVFALIGVWWACSFFGITSPYLLPSPEDVFSSFTRLLTDGTLLTGVIASLKRSLTGFCLASVFGIFLAYLMVKIPKCFTQTNLILESLRMIPPLSLIPLLIIWLGIGESPKIAIVVLASFFPIYLNAFSGFKSVSKRYDELATLLSLTHWERFQLVEMPGALPQIFAGLRIGFGYSWRALIGAELIAASSGIGFMIIEAGQLARTDEVIVGVLVIAVLGVAGDALLKIIFQKIAPWGALWNS